MANSLRLAPFDRDREFVTNRDFMFQRENLAANIRFPKELATTRTLRLLYDSRAIGYADDASTVKAPPAPPPPAPSAPVGEPMTEDEKKKLLRKRKDFLQGEVEKLGVTVDPDWEKADLVEEIARARDGAALK
jgi:hypothetical protein